jgi:hypothetical protein
MKKLVFTRGATIGLVSSLALISVWLLFVVPAITDMPITYTYEARQAGWTDVYAGERFLENNQEPEAVREQVIIMREDIVRAQRDRELTIESLYQGLDALGNITFEGANTYVVNARTRANVVGRNGTGEEGQYIFPQRVKKQDYLFSSPEVIEAPSYMKFVSVKEIRGLTVYQFAYEIPPVDKTVFFPEDRFLLRAGEQIVGDHSGTVLVEPVSGMIVKYDHRGTNFVVDEEGNQVALLEDWFNVTTENDVARLLTSAQQQKSLLTLHFKIVPTLFGLLALAFLAALIRQNQATILSSFRKQ